MSSMADQEVLRRRDDAEMMRRPNLWPMQVLPMKRSGLNGSEMDCGIFVCCDDDGALKLWNANRVELSLAAKPGDTIAEALARVVDAKHPAWEYDSIEACLADGWGVD